MLQDSALIYDERSLLAHTSPALAGQVVEHVHAQALRKVPFFADAFPPTVFARLGPIGWVPTLELTVHVRRRPAPGWLACHVWCDDVHNGKLIESCRLWDSTGELVAQSRQLGYLITGNVGG